MPIMATSVMAREASESVRAARIDLAAAHRLACRDGLNEGTWNHFTLRHPDDPERMLMTPPDTHWSQVTASSLLDVGPDFEPEGSAWIAYRIHYPVHSARASARCVLHVHSPAITAMTMLRDCRLRMVEQKALMFYGRYAVTDDFDGLKDPNTDQGQVMADAMGDDKDILFLRNHGAVVVGPTVAQAYTELYMLERTCDAQLRAMATGLPMTELDEDQMRVFGARTRRDERENKTGEILGRSFEAMKRVLDATEPDYRT